jgi:hypothetical protein
MTRDSSLFVVPMVPTVLAALAFVFAVDLLAAPAGAAGPALGRWL